MTTQSVGWALSWEYWRRGMLWFVPAVVLLTLTFASVGGLLTALNINASEQHRQLQAALIGFLLSLPLLLAYASVSALRRQYILPVRTRTLVGWSLLNGAAATAGAYLVVALVCNAWWQADWPLLGPAWLAVANYTAAQAAAWWAGESRSRGVVLSAGWLAAVVGLFAVLARIYPVRDLPETAAGAESGLAEIVFAGSIVLIAAAYLAAVACVARDRCGERWSLLSLGRWWPHTPGAQTASLATVLPQRTFRSPEAAQFYLEWRAKGRYLPRGVAVLAVGLWLCFANLRLRESDVMGVLSGCHATFVFASFFVGLSLGAASKRFDLGPFLATRPLTDTALARAVLRNVAASLGAAALVWSLGLLLNVSTWSPRAWQEFWRAASADPLTAWANLIGPPLIIVLVIWTLLSLGATLALTRSWFVPCGTLGLLGSLLLMAYLSQGQLERVLVALVLPALCLAGTVAAFVIAWRRGLISRHAVLGSGVGYALLLGLVWWAQGRDNQILAGLAALPFLPFAAAPLALSWNRHR